MSESSPSRGIEVAPVPVTAAPLASERPYLQIFGPDTGVFTYYLERAATIGRSAHANIRLPHHTVSRIHATVALEDGRFVLEDAESSYGVSVNSQRVGRHVLQHGDSIQISLYVLQFRTHPALPGSLAALARAKYLLRSDFSLLPSTMRLKYRMLDVAAREIFRTGDTLRVGQGGLLVPSTIDPGENVGLELELRWPSQQAKLYLGEIMGAIEEGGTHWICVKLHTIARDIHDAVVSAAAPSEWQEVPAT